jgi:hypothetical protein
MNRNKKVVAFGIGIIALGGIGWYIMKKQKEENDTKSRLGNAGDPLMPLMADMLQSGQAQGTSGTPSASTYNPSLARIRVSNASGNGKYKWYGVDRTSDRKKFDAGAQIGTYGEINGTEACTISNFWIDSNGGKAAFQCEEKAPGSYDIPNGSRFEY